MNKCINCPDCNRPCVETEVDWSQLPSMEGSYPPLEQIIPVDVCLKCGEIFIGPEAAEILDEQSEQSE